MWQKQFYCISLLVILTLWAASLIWPKSVYFFIVIVPVILLGISDTFSKNNVLYNFPVIGHIRFLMEFISPEIRQYFLENNKSGRPYNRQQRDLVKKRAQGVSGTHPFGTERDIKKEGFNFTLHSINVKKVPLEAARIMIGGPNANNPTIALA